MSGTITKLKELPRVFAAWKLVDEICFKISKSMVSDNMITLMIKKAIEDKIDNVVIVKTLKEMAKDNFILVSNILGDELTNKIINFS